MVNNDTSKKLCDRYCVFGNPIAHSLSPEIHRSFAQQCKQDILYDKRKVECNEFSLVVNTFFSEGGKGLNITVPFKQEAWELADCLSERARLAGAVNTLYRNQSGLLCGDNTDGAGLVSDILLRNKWPIKGKKILVLGAGGAARGVLRPLLAEQPEGITIVNRTPSKAETLANIFSQYGRVSAQEYDNIGNQHFDLLINATSASLSSELPPLPERIIGPSIAVYDMVYARQLTPFLNWCGELGALKLSDGLGMLVGQAAESFKIWRGIMPEVQTVIDMLRHK